MTHYKAYVHSVMVFDWQWDFLTNQSDQSEIHREIGEDREDDDDNMDLRCYA